ncbi:MAG TPA: GTP 3',8-cyclase MoaA, partial [Gammaproteobacteria bacterium]|nr:GTP 3',8-cyclase MoaA [Gammaproteobacteria bacterium]
ANPGDLERLKQAIVAAMDLKPKGHDFDLTAKPIIFRHMSVTGG